MVAGLLAILLLALSLVAARELAAHSLQTDSGHDGGACFLCLLAHGKLDQAAPTQVPVRWIAQPFEIVPAAWPTGFCSLAFELPPGRGPPAGLPSLPQAER